MYITFNIWGSVSRGGRAVPPWIYTYIHSTTYKCTQIHVNIHMQIIALNIHFFIYVSVSVCLPLPTPCLFITHPPLTSISRTLFFSVSLSLPLCLLGQPLHCPSRTASASLSLLLLPSRSLVIALSLFLSSVSPLSSNFEWLFLCYLCLSPSLCFSPSLSVCLPPPVCVSICGPCFQ